MSSGRDRQQLDLFIDGREALLVHEVVTGLLARDVARAEKGLRRLSQEHPGHVDLAALAMLIDTLTARLPASVDHAALTERIEATERALVPAARRFLGVDAGAFLRPLWRSLAETAANLPFDPAHPRAHRGWLWQQPDEWANVRTAVEEEPGWAATPTLRYWLGLAQHHLGAHEAAVRLWLPLCWMDPALFAQVAPALPSPIISTAWAAFERVALFEDSVTDTMPGAPWFPAWLLLRHRGLAHLFQAAEIPDAGSAARVFRHLLVLIPLEHHGLGDELIRQRRALRQLDPGFFRYYMETLGQRSPRA
ncbi:MAG TPA: hypothetical protein VLA62_02905 [Solirubrobacterales bacterium]|nr:hypothetical protein [Solirubrobacterales bacterium]